MTKPQQIVICIPGNWVDRSQIVTSIAGRAQDYLFAGMVLMHTKTGMSFELEVCERDERMRAAFNAAGGGRLNAEDMLAIDDHTHVLYLIGEGGSLERAYAVMRAALALLRCGGIAVKIETTGIAHSSAEWEELCEYSFANTMIAALVIYVWHGDRCNSCGMHNIGLRDAEISSNLGADEAADLLRCFLNYLAGERPTINDGQTFSAEVDAPVYRLSKIRCTSYPSDDLFYNPNGLWRLEREDD